MPARIVYEQANIFSNFGKEGFDSALYYQLKIVPWLGREYFYFYSSLSCFFTTWNERHAKMRL
jgi:hypothetical protein